MAAQEFIHKKAKRILQSFKRLFSFAKNFSLTRTYFAFRLKLARKNRDSEKEDLYLQKIEDFDYIKTNVLAKYFAKELSVYFFICFLFFFVVFFVNQILLLAETILRMRVPLFSVIRLITYCLPGIIAQSSPFATLVGFLMCLGRMVTDNEILILRASGLRYRVILKPVIFIGLIISFFSFIMNDYFLPLGTLNYNRMSREIVSSNPAVELESHSIKRMKNSILVFGEVEGSRVSDVVVFDSDGMDQRLIVAKDSSVQKSFIEGVIMSMSLNDACVFLLNVQSPKNYDVIECDNVLLNIFEDSVAMNLEVISPREMTSYDLGTKIKELEKDDGVSKKKLNRYKLEFNKKFSIPFGSIFFALLAFPLALIFGRKDGQTLGMIFGIIISVLYWAATMLGQTFGLRGGYNGFWMMWTPNFVIGIIGIILYRKLRKK